MSRPPPNTAAVNSNDPASAAVAAALDDAPAATLTHALKLASEDGPPLIAWGWLTLALARTPASAAQRRAATAAHRTLSARMSPAQLACATQILGRSVVHRFAPAPR